MAKITTSGFRGRRALVATLVLTLLVALGAGFAIAKNARVLGKTKDTPKPLCPGDKCLVTGTVSLFMRIAGGEKGEYKFPADGKVVGWSVDLSKPSKSQVETFESDDLFGGPAAARVGILKSQGKDRFKLLRQTSKIGLTRYFGTKPIFTLNKPLNVKKGHIAALTIPTWIPAYACDVALDSNGSPFCRSGTKFSRKNLAVVSRPKDRCTGEREDILGAKPQQKIGSVRPYACKLAGERVLYRVYWVPDE